MGKLISATLTRAVLAVLIVVALGPILWTVLGAFKELRDIVTPVPKLFFEPTLENFATILRNPTIRDGLLNSVIVVSAAVLVGAVLGIPAAHTLARHARNGATTCSSLSSRCASCRRWPSRSRSS